MLNIKKESEHLYINIGKLTLKIGLYRLFHLKKRSIVILEQGGFGDYICCRHYFKYLKEKYRSYHIIYICQDWTAQFSKIYDSNYIDEVISFNRDKFKSEKLYRKLFLNYINKTYNIEKYIHLTPFNIGIGKGGQLSWRIYLAKKIKAKEKYVPYMKYADKREPQLRFFNKPINIDKYLFCTDANKQFFEKILNMQIGNDREKIDVPAIYDRNISNVIVSIGASADFKMFPINKWIEIINYLTSEFQTIDRIIFIGTKSEKKFVDEILLKINNLEKCLNLVGEIDISALPLFLKNTKLLISMESGNTHLAESLNCPTLCLCGGFYYKKSQPYVDTCIEYLYPPKFMEIVNSNDKEKIKEIYFDYDTLSVKDINSADVIQAIKKYLV